MNEQEKADYKETRPIIQALLAAFFHMAAVHARATSQGSGNIARLDARPAFEQADGFLTEFETRNGI